MSFFLMAMLLVACGQAPSIGSEHAKAYADAQRDVPIAAGKEVHGEGQLTEYVRRIFQDSKGHFWFGSNGDGIYRYDGKTLEVFSTEEGLAGSQVTGILEDRNGHIWISTDGGVSRYDGRSFTNYTTKDGLSSNGCWSIFEARDGTIWVGTAAGPSRFDGKAPDQSGRGRFIPLALPTGNVDQHARGYWTACITQDRKGDLWFATREAGAFKYDGRSFQRLNKANGLDDDELACILVDSKDRVWISTMFGGLVMYDGRVVKRLPAPNDIGNQEIWTVIEDRQGNIWFSAEGYGVYRFDGTSLSNFSEKQGLGVRAVQSIHQDRGGRLWFGGGGGLYRLEGDSMVHVKRNGPWR